MIATENVQRRATKLVSSIRNVISEQTETSRTTITGIQERKMNEVYKIMNNIDHIEEDVFF